MVVTAMVNGFTNLCGKEKINIMAALPEMSNMQIRSLISQYSYVNMCFTCDGVVIIYDNNLWAKLYQNLKNRLICHMMNLR